MVESQLILSHNTNVQKNHVVNPEIRNYVQVMYTLSNTTYNKWLKRSYNSIKMQYVTLFTPSLNWVIASSKCSHFQLG